MAELGPDLRTHPSRPLLTTPEQHLPFHRLPEFSGLLRVFSAHTHPRLLVPSSFLTPPTFTTSSPTSFSRISRFEFGSPGDSVSLRAGWLRLNARGRVFSLSPASERNLLPGVGVSQTGAWRIPRSPRRSDPPNSVPRAKPERPAWLLITTHFK